MRIDITISNDNAFGALKELEQIHATLHSYLIALGYDITKLYTGSVTDTNFERLGNTENNFSAVTLTLKDSVTDNVNAK